MTTGGNLTSYLERCGLRARGETTPGLEEIVAGHLRSIPFETFDLLLDIPVADLSWDALTDKLVHRRRGGYCFEHNTLLGHVLRTLGYHVDFLTGRVEWGDPQTLQARTHQALVVARPGHPGRQLVDVGFGGQTLSSPIDFDSTDVQQTRHEPYRIVHRSAGRALQALVREEWRTLYVLALDPQEQIDLEVGSWYVSTHPESGFRRGVRASRITDAARTNLSGETLTVHDRVHGTSRRQLDGATEVLEVLGDEFGIDPQTDGLADAVGRELARPEQ